MFHILKYVQIPVYIVKQCEKQNKISCLNIINPTVIVPNENNINKISKNGLNYIKHSKKWIRTQTPKTIWRQEITLQWMPRKQSKQVNVNSGYGNKIQ